MIDEGISLEGLATPSSGAAAGTRSAMPARSTSTTTGRATSGTTSASADPRNSCLDAGHGHGRPTLGREIPGDPSPKARQHAQPGTVAVATAAATERGNDLWKLTTLDKLLGAWMKARKNKGKCTRIQRFAEDPLRYLSIIQNHLRNRTYTFGPYQIFTVREKKFRDVVDAPMKDRIVHWMLYEHLLPIWRPRFIHDTYGNLPGRGTHAAIRRLADFCRSPKAAWVLQLDISKYFYSVRHDLLKARVLKHIGDEDLRRLLIALVDSFRTGDNYDAIFPPDSPYHQTADKGMPIGNLSSQLFANIFLNEFDHWVKEGLRIKRYIRYVDDMVFLGESREELQAVCNQVIATLAMDGLVIHPKKIRLAPVSAGVPFLGYVIWPGHVSAGQYLRKRYYHRLRQQENDGQDRHQSLRSYQAALAHTGSTR